MQVNANNAAVVAVIFAKLADARFTMRTPQAIVKDTELTVVQVLETSAQMGLMLRRSREEQPRVFIERPAELTIEKSMELSEKAKAILAGSSEIESFEVDFNIVAEALPTDEDDIFGGIEGGLPN